MKDFIKGFFKGILYVVMVYFFIMLFLNLTMGMLTDESIEVYKPIWNIREFM